MKMLKRRTLTGAWIETGDISIMLYDESVAPSRVRGLKLQPNARTRRKSGRTLTGAWIETYLCYLIKLKNVVAPSRVRGLKLSIDYDRAAAEASHPHGCVD